ncbi:hypothetical protein BLNAU_8282 [Blattamonas nauphoetae]|uniref:Cadherin-like beta sandwich domain-containing protein n=1 Tax=Blattamonas nauphoetae TaxID=2049346 RepID=A0ABQ9XZD4_9EUKA|nr:hypothetical protein BLNAU_8282 [Blattamonas nauphoetae]
MHLTCTLDESHTEAIVTLIGKYMDDGEYQVTLSEGKSFNIRLLTGSTGNTTGASNLGRIGDGTGWPENSNWTVVSVIGPSSVPIELRTLPPITIPIAARLSGVDVERTDTAESGKVTLSFSSVKLEKGKEYTMKLAAEELPAEELTRTFNTTSEGLIPAMEEVLFPLEPNQDLRAQQMKYGLTYKVTSLHATGRTNSVQVSSGMIEIQAQPVRLTNIEVIDETETTLTLLVTGSGFVSSQTYTVEVSGVLTGSESENAHTRTFTVVASSATSASSSTHTLSNDNSTSLHFSCTYTVQKLLNGTDEGIVVGTRSFDTPDPTRVTDVFVNRGGNSDASECGSSDIPCCSVYVSWTAIHLKESAETSPVLRVEMEAELGGLLDIGQLELEIRGREEKRGRLIVESGLEWEEEGREGGIEVDGGRLGLFDLVLVLPSLSLPLSPQRAVFAVSGNGQFEAASVRIAGSNGGRIGVGFVGWRSGEAKLTSLEMDGVSFEDGVCVVNGTSVTEVLSLRMESCSIRSTTTTNSPLILFSSSSPSSSFSLSSTHILHSHRIQRTASSHSPLVSISTAQKATTLSNCVFAEGGCVYMTGSLSDSILSLSLTSPSSSSLTLLACLVIDCSPPTTTGKAALTITTTTALARIRLESCWVEETAESGSVFPFVDGVPTLPPTRRIVYSTLSSKIGVLIERDSTVPVVVRKGTGLSACRLLVQQKQHIQLVSIWDSEMNESDQN